MQKRHSCAGTWQTPLFDDLAEDLAQPSGNDLVFPCLQHKHRYADTLIAGGVNPTNPDRWVRPAWLWVVRNWMWAGPLALAVLTAIGLLWSRLNLEQWRAGEATRKAAEAENRERDQQLKVQLLELQQLRMTMHRSGWREKALALAQQIAPINPAEVQPEAAACLYGLDARVTKEWRERGDEPGGWSKLSSSGVAYSSDGRLYAGGWQESVGFVWDGRQEQRSSRVGRGPVGFVNG